MTAERGFVQGEKAGASLEIPRAGESFDSTRARPWSSGAGHLRNGRLKKGETHSKRTFGDGPPRPPARGREQRNDEG